MKANRNSIEASYSKAWSIPKKKKNIDDCFKIIKKVKIINN
jgi:hypothetical protein